MMVHVFDLGKVNREEGVSTQQAVRENLDRLKIGQELEVVKWSKTRGAAHLVGLPAFCPRPGAAGV